FLERRRGEARERRDPLRGAGRIAERPAVLGGGVERVRLVEARDGDPLERRGTLRVPRGAEELEPDEIEEALRRPLLPVAERGPEELGTKRDLALARRRRRAGRAELAVGL